MLETARRQVNRLERWESGTVKVLGIIEVLLASILLAAALFASIVGDDHTIFLIPAVPVLLLGFFQMLFFSNNGNLTPSLGVLLIAEVWAVAFAVLSVPFLLYGFPPIDALFETVSGFTTTGASVADVGSLPDSLLLWRGLTQWAGGITIVVIFTVMLPMIGIGSSGFASNEFAGTGGGYTMRVASAALNFMKVYVFLTVAEAVMLVALGVSPLESVCITMSDVPTGGLLPRSDSMVSYSVYVQSVTLLFMLLGATNYYMMFRLLIKRDTALFRNAEFKVMVGWFAVCSAVIAGLIVHNNWDDVSARSVGDSIWNALYAVVSAGTSTGFAIADYSSAALGWGGLAMMVLLLVMFVGGMSGSTAGGIKVYRLMILKSYISAGMNRIIHPGTVSSVKVNGEGVDDNAVVSAISTIILMFLGAVVGIALIMFLEPGIDLRSAFGVVVASVTNAGIGTSPEFGPLGSFEGLGAASKGVLCILMWLGRMEMTLALILLTRKFWSDVRLNVGRGVNVDRRMARFRRARREKRARSLAHGEDAEYGGVPRLHLVDGAGGDLGLPERAPVGEAVPDGLQRADVLRIDPQRLRGERAGGGGVPLQPLVVGGEGVSVGVLPPRPLPCELRRVPGAAGEDEGGHVRPAGAVAAALPQEPLGGGHGLVVPLERTEDLHPENGACLPFILHGVELGEGLLVLARAVADRRPGPAHAVGGREASEDGAGVAEAPEADESLRHLVAARFVGGEVRCEEGHDAGEALLPPDGAEHRGAGQEDHRVQPIGGSQLQDLRARQVVPLLPDVLPDGREGGFVVHWMRDCPAGL